MTKKEKIEYTTIAYLLLTLANMHAANEFKLAELLHKYLWTDDEYKNITKIMRGMNEQD